MLRRLKDFTAGPGRGCKNHYPGKTNSSQLPKSLSMKKRNLSTKKNVKSICPVCPSSRSFHPALEAYLRSFGRKEPLDLALPHPSPDRGSFEASIRF